MDNIILRLSLSANNIEEYTGLLYKHYGIINFKSMFRDIEKRTREEYGSTIIVDEPEIAKFNLSSQRECIYRIIISMDGISNMPGLMVTSGAMAQNIMLSIKNNVEAYLNTIGILYTFNNKVESERALNLESVTYYEFNFNDSISIPEESLLESSTDDSIIQDGETPTNDEEQKKSRDIDNQSSNSVVNIVGGGIQNIFPPTIQLPSIDFDIDAPEATKDEIAAHIGVVPFIYYNGIEIKMTNVHSFRMTSTGVLPEFVLIFSDPVGSIKDNMMPLDDTKIRFFLNSMLDGVKNIDIQFKISNYKRISVDRFFMSGIMDMNSMFVPKYEAYRGNSSTALQSIMKSIGLGFNTNVSSPNDEMTWINTGMTIHDYTKHIIKHSYISDKSFIYGFTDYYYNYNYVDVSNEIERDIKEDLGNVVLNVSKGIDPNIEGFTNAPFLTNIEGMDGTNYFFKDFKIFNNSAELSQETGYRTRTKYYDTLSKELLAFDVASNMNGEDTSKIILRSADEVYLNENILHRYDGKLDTDNMHKNYIYADILNERNITDLEKIGIIIELDNPNYNIYKFQKIVLLLSNGSASISHAHINERLSGEWIISDINYTIRRGIFRQEIILLRRELELSNEEMEMMAKRDITDTFVNRTRFKNPSSGGNTDVGEYVNNLEDEFGAIEDEPIEPLPGGDIITPEELREIFGMSMDKIRRFHTSLNNELKSNNYTTLYRVAHTVAQIWVESKFEPVQENLNYSAAGLRKTFPTRVTQQEAQRLARKPKQIANKVYGGRYGNGPESSGDGWRYSGKGFIQLTFKDNYQRCGKSIGVNIVDSPHLLLQTKYAMKSVFWFFKDKRIDRHMDKNDVNQVSKLINGGTNHLAERKKFTRIAISVLSKRLKRE